MFVAGFDIILEKNLYIFLWQSNIFLYIDVYTHILVVCCRNILII